MHESTVHAVAFEPGAVLVEVGADRAHQHRGTAQLTHAERDVRCHAAAAHNQIVHEEGQRHLVQLIGEQLFGEPARKVHEVVGSDRTRNKDGHSQNAT